MIRRPLTLALVPLALTAQLSTAHAQPVRPETAPAGGSRPGAGPDACRITRSRRARRATS